MWAVFAHPNPWRRPGSRHPTKRSSGSLAHSVGRPARTRRDPPMSPDTLVTHPAAGEAAPPLLERHRELLEQAVAAIAARGFWSAYSELPKAYGEEAPRVGREAF